ncbi:hypothetical protein [Tessaracoccus sp.]
MAITLLSDVFEVVLIPERGADVVGLTDLATGVQTLAVSPTGETTSAPLASGDSMAQWINGYPGGWQVLIPNAGPERIHDGVSQGYHGEASLARWSVLEESPASATLTTCLSTAPLKLERRVSLEGQSLTVVDLVTNLSPEPVSFRLGQHPAFGTPFLDERSYIVTEASTLIMDASAPGTFATANEIGPPTKLLPPGPVPHSVALPGPGSGQALFGALTDFPGTHQDPDEAEATLFSPTHGFGMQLRWDLSVYPNAWLWFEANAGTGWPWFTRLYAIAVEPVNVLPGEGMAPNGRPRGGDGATVAGGASLSATLRITRVPL